MQHKDFVTSYSATPEDHTVSLESQPALNFSEGKALPTQKLGYTEQTAADCMNHSSSPTFAGTNANHPVAADMQTMTSTNHDALASEEVHTPALDAMDSTRLSDSFLRKPRFASESYVTEAQYNAQLANLDPQIAYQGIPAFQSSNDSPANQPHDFHVTSPTFGAATARSFSGNLVSSASNITGMPASPFIAHDYMAPNAGASSQATGFTSPSHAQTAAFINAQNTMGPVFNPTFTHNHSGMPTHQGGYPAFLPTMGMLGPPQQSNATGRTVYVGNLPAEASVDELLSLVKFGPIENVRLLPEKNCAFISFLDGNMAAAFHADATVKKLSLHNQELKIGWGKPSICPPPILMAVQQNQATRNVYLGQLEDDTTEQNLRDDLARFGPIDQVKIVRDKNIGFVHFLSIATAMKVISVLPSEPAWAGKRINYGKDRCAYVPRSQQQNQAHNSQAAAMGMAAAASLGYPTALGGHYGNFTGLTTTSTSGDESRSPAAVASVFAPMANSSALQQMGNRTVYLGNIHPDTTTEEICNHIRGGILQNIRFIPEKHIAFITFVDSNAALAFYHLANYSGVMIHQRRLKVGWGKHSGPLNPAIAMAVQTGGSRNVYIGNIEDFLLHTVDKLRQDFSEYGETELVNTLREKNCAFVNFCNIQNAIKAIEAMKNHPDYKNQRIGAGKDRCGNPPRAVANSINAARSSSHSPNPEGSPFEADVPSDTLDASLTASPGADLDASDERSAGLIPGEN